MGWWGKLLFISFISLNAFGFISKDNTEAIFRYSHFVEYESETKPGKRVAQKEAEKQVEYLFGSMGSAETYAVPKGEENVTVTSVEEAESGTYHIHYNYEGKIQLKKGPRTRYSVFLPKNTSEEFIYDAGLTSSGKNRCTDGHYNSYEDYSYFWNPTQKGCKLEEGVHYDSVEGSIDRIPNTENTYPDYKRLVREKSDGSKEILIYVFLGMDDPNRSHDPMRSQDFNAIAYRAIRKTLQDDLEFSKPEKLEDEEFSRIFRGKRIKRPHVEVLNKQSKKANIKVILYFGETGIDEQSKAFHYFYKEANEKASMMIYDGHSGDSLSLDLLAIQRKQGFRIVADKKHYQIFMFNSCTSYNYYNTAYFYRKDKTSVRNMTKNLDILTNGLPTFFDEEQITNLSLIRAVDTWAAGKKPPKYLELAQAMDQRNLFAVNGDEDNPTTP